MVGQAGEQGEVNPMCSLELRSRLEELQLQNEKYQRQIEEKYQTYLTQQRIQYDNLSHHVNELLYSIQSNRSHALRVSSHSQHYLADPSYRYHPYSQPLTVPGIAPGFVRFFLKSMSNPSADQVWNSIQLFRVMNIQVPRPLMVVLGTTPLLPVQLHLTAQAIICHRILMLQSHRYPLAPVNHSLSCKWPSILVQSPNWAETSRTVHGNRLWKIGNIRTHLALFSLQWSTGIQPFSSQGQRRWNLDNAKLSLLNLLMCEFYFFKCQSCWPLWHLLFHWQVWSWQGSFSSRLPRRQYKLYCTSESHPCATTRKWSMPSSPQKSLILFLLITVTTSIYLL